MCKSEGGSCVCNDEDLSNSPRVDALPLPSSTMVLTDPGHGAKSPLDTLDRIQGRWFRQHDSQAMGQIIGSQVFWDPAFQHMPCKLKLQPNGELEMELGGQTYKGKYEPPNLIWSDGEIWVRSPTEG